MRHDIVQPRNIRMVIEIMHKRGLNGKYVRGFDANLDSLRTQYPCLLPVGIPVAPFKTVKAVVPIKKAVDPVALGFESNKQLR